MTKPSTALKLALSAPQTIALDKLEIHEDNVRKSDEVRGAIEELAADIAARGLNMRAFGQLLLEAHQAKSGEFTTNGARESAEPKPIEVKSDE